MENANKTYDLKVEKIIHKPAAEVFRAISEGRLFQNCSADHESMKIDFRVGGKYAIEFLAHNMKNGGEFLEIVKNQKIVFTWCQDHESNATPDTTVRIELKDLGNQTALTLTHSGFTDKENRDGHEGGWKGGLEDLTQEITIGKLRFTRQYPFSLERLFEICKDPKSQFGHKGEFIEMVPNQKIIFGIQDTKVSLLLEADDDKKTSWLELLHEGLNTESQQKNDRAKWDSMLKHLK